MEDIIETYIGKKNVKVIFEAGACDCNDTLGLALEFPNSHVYAFECNPETLPLCRNKVSDRITLTEKAVTEHGGDVTFYPIDTKLTKTTHANGNPGASSLLKANPEYPIEKYVQKEITVPSTSLKTFCSEQNITDIDILWLDAQGTELSILKGLGDMLSKVKVIKTEVLFKEQYFGAPLFEEVEEWLDAHGFRFVRFLEKYEWFGDVVFINKNL